MVLADVTWCRGT